MPSPAPIEALLKEINATPVEIDFVANSRAEREALRAEYSTAAAVYLATKIGRAVDRLIASNEELEASAASSRRSENWLTFGLFIFAAVQVVLSFI